MGEETEGKAFAFGLVLLSSPVIPRTWNILRVHLDLTIERGFKSWGLIHPLVDTTLLLLNCFGWNCMVMLCEVLRFFL